MRSTRLLRLLSRFSPADHRHFREMVISPFFNKNPLLSRQLEFIYSQGTHFEHESLTKENAFSYVFGEGTFDPKKVDKLNSHLYHLATRYIAMQQEFSNTLSEDLHLLRFFNNEGLTGDFENLANQIKKTILKNELPLGVGSRYQHFLFEQEINRYTLLHRGGLERDLNYDHVCQALDRFYLLMRLVLSCQKENLHLTRKTTLRLPLEEQILFFLTDSTYLNDDPIMRVWFTAHQMFTAGTRSEQERHFHALLDLLCQHRSELSHIELRNLYGFLQNMTGELFSGDQYYEVLAGLYERQLRENVFSGLTNLTTDTLFLNLVLTNLRLGRLALVEELLASPAQTGLSLTDESVGHLCRGLLFFEQGRYEEALDEIANLFFRHPAIDLVRRRLEIKSLFARGEVYRFELANQKFYIYLYRGDQGGKAPSRHVEPNKHFSQLIKKINETPAFETQKVEKLRLQIMEAKERELAEKHWLEKAFWKKYGISATAPVASTT